MGVELIEAFKHWGVMGMSQWIAGLLLVAFVYFVVRRLTSHSPKAIANKLAGEEFLAHNRDQEGVKETASGLQYRLLDDAEGRQPTAKDTVRVHYHGTLIDGTVFDSSLDRGEAISFPLNRVIKGWTEGVQLMQVGQKMRLYVPYHLAYGARAAGTIQPYSALIFDVELLAIHD